MTTSSQTHCTRLVSCLPDRYGPAHQLPLQQISPFCFLSAGQVRACSPATAAADLTVSVHFLAASSTHAGPAASQPADCSSAPTSVVLSITSRALKHLVCLAWHVLCSTIAKRESLAWHHCSDRCRSGISPVNCGTTSRGRTHMIRMERLRWLSRFVCTPLAKSMT